MSEAATDSEEKPPMSDESDTKAVATTLPYSSEEQDRYKTEIYRKLTL